MHSNRSLVIAGFFTGGALAVRGGVKAARNSAIMCAVFLGVIEGVGIGFQRMMADNTKLEVRCLALLPCVYLSSSSADSYPDLAPPSPSLRAEGSCLNSPS